MSLTDIPTNLTAIVEIANARTKPKLLTLPDESGQSNFEVLEVRPYSASTNDHNSIATVRVDLGYGNDALPIPEHERYSIRKVPFTRIDLKDIAAFKGLEKNDQGQYTAEDLTVDALSELLGGDVADHVSVVAAGEGVAILKALPKSIGYIGAVTFAGKSNPPEPEPEPPVENELVTSADKVKLETISKAPNGEFIYGAVAGSSVYVNLSSAVTEKKDVIIRLNSDPADSGIRATLEPGVITSVPVKLPATVGTAVFLGFGEGDQNVLALPGFGVNKVTESVTEVRMSGFEGQTRPTATTKRPINLDFIYATDCFTPETVSWSMVGADGLDITLEPVKVEGSIGRFAAEVSFPDNVVTESTLVTVVATVNGVDWNTDIQFYVPEITDIELLAYLNETDTVSVPDGQPFYADETGSLEKRFSAKILPADYAPKNVSIDAVAVNQVDSVIVDWENSTGELLVAGVTDTDIPVRFTITVDGTAKAITIIVKPQ